MNKPCPIPRFGLLTLALLLFIAACGSGTTVVIPTERPSPTADEGTSIAPSELLTSAFPSVADVVQEVIPAVVSIVVETVGVDFFLHPLPPTGAGSGVIFDPQGFIVTNNHVVAGADEITVSLPDDRVYEATIVGRDPLTDLAVIKIEEVDLPIIPFGNSGDLQPGEFVIAIGNALGLEGGPTVTVGVVSALGRSIRIPSGATLQDLIQTDAAINPGNSGGPLINLKGEVIGINTAIANPDQAQGIGFAISTPTIIPIIADLVENGRVVRAQLGIVGQALTPILARRLGLPSETSGVLITDISRGSGADEAGIRSGDVIIRFEDDEISTIPELQYNIWARSVGDTVEVTILRNGEEMTLTAILGERPPES